MKRDNFSLPLGFSNELLIDNFAGGGGASEGIEQAFGRPIDVAINHDGEALAMHAANHPSTKHYQEDVFNIHPGFVTGQQPIGLAWFSPDCKHHSKAKGGKPREKKIRGLAWITLKWATFQMPRCIALENVEEFKDWGPLDDDGNPIKSLKGRTFGAFIAALSTGVERDHPDTQEIYDALGAYFPMDRLYAGLGYKVEYKILRACDYGTPTIRKRLFIFARRDGLPIVWPAPTHGNPKLAGFKGSGLLPWLTAADCIDFSIPCPSIFERDRPLAEKTLERIAKGITRFVIENADPFIVKFSENSVGQPVDEPLHTVMAGAPRFALVSPIITECANGSNQRNMRADEPLRTQCAEVKGGHFALVSAMLAKHYTGVTGTDVRVPFGTVTSVDHHSLVTSNLLKLRNNQFGQEVAEPLPTLTAGGGHVCEVRAFLVKYYGNEKTGVDITDPMHTLPTKDRIGLVTVKGEDYLIIDIGMRMLTPRELARAQGFPESYILDPTFNGKPLTKTAQVRMIGNSVCPPLARALIEANFKHEAKIASAA